jgi:hypothetical protein
MICRTRPDVFVFFAGALTTTSCVYHNIDGEGRRERVVSDGPDSVLSNGDFDARVPI